MAAGGDSSPARYRGIEVTPSWRTGRSLRQKRAGATNWRTNCLWPRIIDRNRRIALLSGMVRREERGDAAGGQRGGCGHRRGLRGGCSHHRHPNPAEPEPTRGAGAPDPRLQTPGQAVRGPGSFLEPGVWSLESLPPCARFRAEGTRGLEGPNLMHLSQVFLSSRVTRIAINYRPSTIDARLRRHSSNTPRRSEAQPR
jgi:hypothetical protein